MGRRMKTIIFSLPLISFACFGVDGSGNVVKDARKVEAFEEVEVSGALEVEVVSGEAHGVVVETDENLLPYVHTAVSGRSLRLKTTKNLDPTKLVVRVTAPKLTRVEASGASEIDVRGLEGERFELELSGASEVKLSGAVKRLDVEASGAADVDASDLVAERVDVEGSGASSFSVHATDALFVDLSGAGNVSYAGDPEQVKTDLSGAASIEKK